MTHLSSTSAAISWFYSSLPNKAWKIYFWKDYFVIDVKCGRILDPTQVHIQVSISRYSYTDDFHEFVGCALARFERSTLPDHKGTRTVVIRFLKIITPVKCVVPDYDDNVYCPKEGELHRRTGRKSGKKAHEVWSVDIDRSKIPRIKLGLQLLWDI